MWVLMNALCKPSLGVPGHVTKILLAENGQKVDEFEPITYILVITDIDEKWFVIFEHTINHLSFGYVVYSNLNTIFLVLHFFSYFLFSFFFCRYLLLKH